MQHNLLYAKTCKINDHISIHIPLLEDVMRDESQYFQLVSIFTAMPIDMMLPLHNAGIDFTKINEFDLFLLLFSEVQQKDTSVLFGDLDFSKFQLSVNKDNGLIVLVDYQNGIVIDREIHRQIADVLRQIHYFKKDRRTPANQEAMEFLIEREKRKAARRKNDQSSQFEPLIVAMVNNANFKYDFETVKKINIYQFNTSVRQIVKKTDYDNKMYGVYTGSISAKDLSPEDLNWLTVK